jgi:hypothetical protein
MREEVYVYKMSAGTVKEKQSWSEITIDLVRRLTAIPVGTWILGVTGHILLEVAGSTNEVLKQSYFSLWVFSILGLAAVTWIGGALILFVKLIEPRG